MTNVLPLRPRPGALEFFAGVGLARIGLERAGFDVVWSNDYEPSKHAMYRAHFGDHPGHEYVVGDIGAVLAADLPRGARLAWASSPCTDLSLAGTRSGLGGRESNAFWLWVGLLRGMGENAPEVAVLENVTGLATSHSGDDLRAAIRGLNNLGYSVDMLALDARRFLPQSRPRMFLVGAKNPPANTADASELRPDWTDAFYADPSLVMHRAALAAPPEHLTSGLSDLVDRMPLDDPRWWDAGRTAAFLASLSRVQRERLAELRRVSGITCRTAYRRTRGGVAVWEIRADDISGCLRTARGGSSKQAVVLIDGKRLQVRWMTPVEYARLMGAGDYNLDGARANQALFAFGDAVAVPVVEWLAKEYLYPLATGNLRADSPIGAPDLTSWPRLAVDKSG
ncbi:MAG: DNA cytosine methyltransferase [Bifidobacteriaceae bacterium]|nr:DNA cytosine methyltransferase [Bifidobacteriaceae bacterium]